MRSLAASARLGQLTEVVVFGDSALPPDLLARLPAIRVARASLSKRPSTINSGITALGLTDAASGAWDRVDVFLQVQGTPGQPDARERLRIDLDGRAVTPTDLRPFGSGYLLSDLPAAGDCFPSPAKIWWARPVRACCSMPRARSAGRRARCKSRAQLVSQP